MKQQNDHLGIRALGTAAIGVMILLIGCSGGEQSAGGGGEADRATTTTNPANSKYCAISREALAAPVDNTPATVRRSYETLNAKGDSLISNAPPKLKREVETMVAGARKLIKVLEPIGYDMSKLDPLSTDTLKNGAFQAASTAVIKYQNQVCTSGTTATTIAR